MGTEEDLRRLIDDAYAAALDEARWPVWMAQLGERVGAPCTVFSVLDRPGRSILAQTINYHDAKALDRYFDERIDRFDPQVAHVSGLSAPSIYGETDHADMTEPGTRDYFSWIDENGGLGHYTTAATPLDGQRLIAAVTLHRRRADGPIAGEDMGMIRALFPALVNALELGFSHAAAVSAAFWDGVTAGVTEPALLLDEKGRILRISGGLDALLACGDGLGIAANRLRADLPHEDAALAAMLERATRAHAPRHGTVRVSRRSHRTPYLLVSHPMPRRARMLAPLEAAALVTIVDPAAHVAGSREHYVAAFGFTPREADVAALLMAGHSAESAAATLEIALATARVHLRALFAKTGTGRQSELVRLLARLAPAA